MCLLQWKRCGLLSKIHLDKLVRIMFGWKGKTGRWSSLGHEATIYRRKHRQLSVNEGNHCIPKCWLKLSGAHVNKLHFQCCLLWAEFILNRLKCVATVIYQYLLALLWRILRTSLFFHNKRLSWRDSEVQTSCRLIIFEFMLKKRRKKALWLKLSLNLKTVQCLKLFQTIRVDLLTHLLVSWSHNSPSSLRFNMSLYIHWNASVSTSDMWLTKFR